ncbi:MAG: branched-chain amino acid ABC transporter permease [Clostridiales bacterium]|nr:branched-chain amino acid ABC transporter permease [Clostridiales bacterium]
MNRLTAKKLNRALLLVLLVISLIIPFLTQNSYRLYFFTQICFYIIAASGLDILFGYAGMISFGHIAYYAIGAYCTALITANTGIPVLISIFISAAIAAGIGALVALPCSKLKFQFLALASIAFAQVVYLAICNMAFLNPYRGMVVKPLTLFGFDLNVSYRYTYYFALVFALLFLLAKASLVNSKYGRAFMAIRDNTRSADGMGINVRRYKVIAFAISSFYVGFAGACSAHLTGLVISNAYVQGNSFNYVIMCIFGGVGTIFGPVVGALVQQLINEALASATAWRDIIFGAVTMLLIAFLPGGIMGTLRMLENKFLRKLGGATESPKGGGGK